MARAHLLTTNNTRLNRPLASCAIGNFLELASVWIFLRLKLGEARHNSSDLLVSSGSSYAALCNLSKRYKMTTANAKRANNYRFPQRTAASLAAQPGRAPARHAGGRRCNPFRSHQRPLRPSSTTAHENDEGWRCCNRKLVFVRASPTRGSISWWTML